MDMTFREIPCSKQTERMNSKELRDSFLFETIFRPDSIVLNYVDDERTVLGGVMPVEKSLKLASPAELRAEYFTERREIGIMNVGAPGKITVDGAAHELSFRDALYIGKGCKDVVFSSNDSNSPAKFYLISYPAHAAYPTTHAKVKDAEPLHLGSDAECNKRTIYKYIFNGGINSSQLVMGFTEMAVGSNWNTMPAHKHMRRTEVYFYFNLPENAVVLHLMGKPDETRHLVVRNEQAVFSPGWSIHAGSGTSNYTFIWAMGGENRDYTDMDPVTMEMLR